MSSEAQIAANRRNALLSTGPKTREGTEASSLDARTCGLSATKVFQKLTRYEAHLHKMLRRDLLDFLNLQRLRHESEDSQSADSKTQPPTLVTQVLISDTPASISNPHSAIPNPQSSIVN